MDKCLVLDKEFTLFTIIGTQIISASCTGKRRFPEYFKERNTFWQARSWEVERHDSVGK